MNDTNDPLTQRVNKRLMQRLHNAEVTIQRPATLQHPQTYHRCWGFLSTTPQHAAPVTVQHTTLQLLKRDALLVQNHKITVNHQTYTVHSYYDDGLGWVVVQLSPVVT